MEEATKNTESSPQVNTFYKRNDFYWQSTAIYALALLLYILLRGTIYEWTVSFVLWDPVVLLFACFILISLIGLGISLYRNHRIIIGEDFIIFKTRLREKKYTLDKILKISISKEKISRVKWRFNVIKIKVIGRKRLIRIRPSSFQDERKLVKCIQHLQNQLVKKS